MYRNRGALYVLITLLSALHDSGINGLVSNSFTGFRFRVSRQSVIAIDRQPVIDFPLARLPRIFTSLSDSVELSHDQQNNNNQNVLTVGDVSASETTNDRRVLQLIPKVSERLLNKDYSGTMWDAICYEASAISEGDLKAATLMSNFILSQPSFEAAVIDFVANQLETPLVQATSIRNLFADICERNPQISSVWALDLMASAMRDSSQPNAVSVLLFNKGFHSLATYRIANALWLEGRDGLAIYFQSLTSRVFGADIHPACTIGYGCSLSGATGVVIGETAVIGNDCSISHDVTLGGNGKEKGDRHPKVGNGVYLAAGAIIMGNIQVGDGSVINAGSVVTKPVKPYTRVGGVPGREISKFSINETYVAELAQLKYIEEVHNGTAGEGGVGSGEGVESVAGQGGEGREFPTSYTDTWGI